MILILLLSVVLILVILFHLFLSLRPRSCMENGQVSLKTVMYVFHFCEAVAMVSTWSKPTYYVLTSKQHIHAT